MSKQPLRTSCHLVDDKHVFVVHEESADQEYILSGDFGEAVAQILANPQLVLTVILRDPEAVQLMASHALNNVKMSVQMLAMEKILSKELKK